MRPLTEEAYNVIVQLINGEYCKPVRDRSRVEKNALIQFWRNRDGLEMKKINGEDVLFHEGKRVLTVPKFQREVQKKTKATKGSGARTIAYSLKRKFQGCSERSVSHVLKHDAEHGQMHAKFSNKPPMRSIQAKKVFDRVQIDLISMRDKAVVYNDRTYKYILTAVDVFSRFLFLEAIERKTAKHVAKALKGIFSQHGYPRIVQSDNGPEFRGQVQRLLAKKKVKVLKGRPYHPQSQGRVERQNRSVKSKIRYDSLKKAKKGHNWVQELPSVAHSLNDQPKEVLGYQSPFCVYFARDDKLPADKIRDKALAASERCATRAAVQYTRRHACSIYRKGDKVLLRYPFKKCRVPQKRLVLKGVVLKRSRRYDRYFLRFRNPKGHVDEQWVGVEEITSRTVEEEKARRTRSKAEFERLHKRSQHKNKFYMVLERNDADSQEIDDGQIERNVTETEQSQSEVDDPYKTPKRRRYFCKDKRVVIAMDPKGKGSCQFESVANQLRKIGIHQSHEMLRRAAVEHIRYNAEHYSDFVTGERDLEDYIQNMRLTSTYGDNLTLQALAREFNCQFLIMNAQGDGYHRILCQIPITLKVTCLSLLWVITQKIKGSIMFQWR